MQFYLGTHRPVWLSRSDVPLFVSRRTLSEYKTPPVALGPWALDSGGFSELSLFGKWVTPAWQYVDEVRRWMDKCGGLQWAAVQDWMCEPFILKKTGKTVYEHQQRTIWSYLHLKSIAPEVPWVPVLQGWEPEDYLSHAEQYDRALPFPLKNFNLVGVGSVCRRQGMKVATEILKSLHGRGISLHGFGFKISGLLEAARYLKSADSMAWSKRARFEDPMPGCDHRKCNNCLRYAISWRDKVLEAISTNAATPLRWVQKSLF